MGLYGYAVYFDGTGYAYGEHLPQCMGMIRREAVADELRAREEEAIEHALARHYEQEYD